MHHSDISRPHKGRLRHPSSLLVYVFLVSLLLILSTQHSALSTQQAHAQQHVSSASSSRSQDSSTQSWITPRGGKPFFIIGANYEGPTDRAWLMWEGDKFDQNLIAADFARAKSLGINTLRIFVQTALRDDINAGDFSKLDTVTALARQNGLMLLLTFTDWAEPDLNKAADLNTRIAAHLANEPSILGYDVKNEPQFTDIAGALYPSNVAVPLQSPDLIAAYGERVSRDGIAGYRRGDGRNIIPARMSDDQAYVMANYYRLFREFLDAGAAWVGSHPGTTTLDYMDSPDSASWASFLAALDSTMGAWVTSQVTGVRNADPGRPITVGYSNIVLAKLPSNRALQFQSVHRFTSHGYSGLNATFLVLNNLQRTFAGQPVLLEEFGYSGLVGAPGGSVQGFDPRTTANLESAIWAYLYSKGFAGGAKWMLNNYTQGANPAENTYGLFDNNNQMKITAHTLRQITDIFSRSAPGTLSSVQPDDNYAVNYSYTSREALIAGGKTYTGTNVVYQSNYPSQLMATTVNGSIMVFATDVSTTDLNLPGIFGVPTNELGQITLTGLDPQGQPWTPPAPALMGDWLRINSQPLHKYRLVVQPRAVGPAEAQPDPATVYFPQTGHNLRGEFLRYWQAHGGLPIFGYPLTEEFTEWGYTVQYFERNRFEYHPENQPPYNVLLGRLGADLLSGLKIEDSRLKIADPQSSIFDLESSTDHRYFPETGHSLHFAFLGYWNRNGGLSQFGYPISEELREVSPTDGNEYTVQYFERARFEYHPENKGTPSEVLLGLLGVNALKARAWLP